jgi:hypothetical protein
MQLSTAQTSSGRVSSTPSAGSSSGFGGGGGAAPVQQRHLQLPKLWCVCWRQLQRLHPSQQLQRLLHCQLLVARLLGCRGCKKLFFVVDYFGTLSQFGVCIQMQSPPDG